MKKLIPIATITALGALLASGRPAQAQTTPASPPPPVTASSGLGHSPAGFGIGAAAFLNNIRALEAVYDQSRWHIEGLFGFNSPDNGPTTIEAGARGWFHLHVGTNSDFSLGGGIGILHVDSQGMMGAVTATSIEPGLQARFFLTPNFSLHAVGGIAMVFGNNAPARGVRTGDQISGDFGFTYYFM